MNEEIQREIIYKWELKEEFGRQIIRMPKDSGFIHLERQCGKICIWTISNPDEKETEDITYVTLRTGEVFPEGDNLYHLGTYMSESQRIVYHVFQKI